MSATATRETAKTHSSTVSEIITTATSKETKAFEEGVLVSVHIGKKSWKMSLTPADFGLTEFPKNFEPGRRRLLPEDALLKIDNIEGQARRAVDKFSFNYGNQNSRVKFRWVHMSKFMLVNGVLNELKANFEVAVDELVKNYEAHKEKMKTDFPDQWAFLEKAYIPAEAIKNEYYFDVTVLNVVFPNQLTAVKQYEIQQADLAVLDREKATKMTEAELAAMRTRYQNELQRTISQAKENAIKQSEEFVDNVVKQLRGKVVEVFQQITAKIKDGKSIIKTNLDTIRSTLHEVRRLDFIGNDAEFHQQLERVQKLIDSGKEFRDDASSVKELNAALAGAVDYINKTDATALLEARKTYFGRKMNLGES